MVKLWTRRVDVRTLDMRMVHRRSSGGDVSVDPPLPVFSAGRDRWRLPSVEGSGDYTGRRWVSLSDAAKADHAAVKVCTPGETSP